MQRCRRIALRTDDSIVLTPVRSRVTLSVGVWLALSTLSPVLFADTGNAVKDLYSMSLDELINIQVVTATGRAQAINEAPALMAVVTDEVPPTINHFTDDPAFDPKLNFTFNKPQKRTIDAALSNTFGFGGHNASIIIKKYKS